MRPCRDECHLSRYPDRWTSCVWCYKCWACYKWRLLRIFVNVQLDFKCALSPRVLVSEWALVCHRMFASYSLSLENLWYLLSEYHFAYGVVPTEDNKENWRTWKKSIVGFHSIISRLRVNLWMLSAPKYIEKRQTLFYIWTDYQEFLQYNFSSNQHLLKASSGG